MKLKWMSLLESGKRVIVILIESDIYLFIDTVGAGAESVAQKLK